MLKKARLYSVLFFLVLSNVFLLKSQYLSSSNNLEPNFSGSPVIGSVDSYEYTSSSLSQNDYLSFSPFYDLSADNRIILYAPPSEGGDPLGIPTKDALWVIVMLVIIYGIYKKKVHNEKN